MRALEPENRRNRALAVIALPKCPLRARGTNFGRHTAQRPAKIGPWRLPQRAGQGPYPAAEPGRRPDDPVRGGGGHALDGVHGQGERADAPHSAQGATGGLPSGQAGRRPRSPSGLRPRGRRVARRPPFRWARFLFFFNRLWHCLGIKFTLFGSTPPCKLTWYLTS